MNSQARVDQFGTANEVFISQRGPTELFTGPANSATVMQSGAGNTATLYQQ
ncbi:hypothetical protein [Pseudomonas sp.]|uniref:hypothetical protein n=1 Tax=Pseudomonas sp. TaxID=306 RepID=UPI00391816A0